MRARRLVWAAAPTLTAAVGSCLLWIAGVRGTDTAAATYRAWLAGHGWVVWSPGWFGGFDPLSYSVLAPTIAAAIGVGAASVIAATAATAAFDGLVRAVAGRPLAGRWWVAVATVLAVGVGQQAWLCGEATALAALWSAAGATGRRAPARAAAAAVLALVTGLLSPLAGAFLLGAAGVWWACERHRMALLGVAVASAVPLAIEATAFPASGPMPFAVPGLLGVEALCAAVVLLPGAANRTVRIGAGAYGLVCLASWAVPNPLGGNAPRLGAAVGVAVLLCSLAGRAARQGDRRPVGSRRRAQAAALTAASAALAAWALAPATELVVAPAVPADTAAYYRPLLGELRRLQGSQPSRAEVVPTADHWESVDVAETEPIARGWERQLDVRLDGLFYGRSPLTPATYLRWLRARGAGWVALPDARLDGGGVAEAALLRRGVPGLVPVWHGRHWILWRVSDATLASGPALVTDVLPDHITLMATSAGSLVVRERWASSWRVTAGDACAARSPGGWIALAAHRPGPVQLRATLGPGAPCRPR